MGSSFARAGELAAFCDIVEARAARAAETYGAKGVDFYEGEKMSAGDIEAKTFCDAVITGATLTVLPQQALVVSEILEAICVSAKTGKPFFFRNGSAGA